MEASSKISPSLEIDLVSFNVPYPPDYGGVIDVFYKIKALSEAGVMVHLHCFDYGRGKIPELEKYCKTVNYYKRQNRFFGLFSKLPYVVETRKSQKLINTLSKTKRPVLLEGIHCTQPLLDPSMNGRKVVVRSHNLEHEYYIGLAKSTHCFWKKLFYKREANKLEKYESIVDKASALACISEPDRKYFEHKYAVLVKTITPFHSFESVKIQEGLGNYVLIHGDLSVPENQKSIGWLINEVASKIPFSVVVAGKNPTKSFSSKLAKYKNVSIVPNPSSGEMDNLVANAQVNLIHSFYPQGFKLKLLHSIYGGRFCICNAEVVENTGLESACIIASSSQDFIRSIYAAFDTSFSFQMVEHRKEILLPFSNSVQARKLIQLLVG